MECPFYARDEEGGLSRDFTPCYGDAVMHGDHALPYTCGSQARRSVIKYFYRNYSSMLGSGVHSTLSRNVSDLIRRTIEALFLNYTSPNSRGCLNATTGVCSLEACSYDSNGFAPCMSTEYVIPGALMAQAVAQDVLLQMPEYYELTLTSTLPWTAYYHGDAGPARWGADPVAASAAADLSQFDTGAPILAYSAQEAFTTPTPEAAFASAETDALYSHWGVCAAKIGGQLAMTLPVDTLQGRPMGNEGNDLTALEAAIQNITRQAMASGSPYVWHADRRHAPSRSRICRSTNNYYGDPHTPARLHVTGAQVNLPQGPITVQADQQESLPLFGFLTGSIGEAGLACVCGTDMPDVTSRCAVDKGTCASLSDDVWRQLRLNQSALCAPLATACLELPNAYDRLQAPLVLTCLRTVPETAAVRCPELGPSDLYWGLFPAGSTFVESDWAAAWVGAGHSDVPLDPTRFLHDPRSGVRLSNYRHLNATFHGRISYASQQPREADAYALDTCFLTSELVPDEASERNADWWNDTLLSELFPAAQLVGDSMLTSVCMRYAVEVARATLLEGTPQGRNAELQATSWRRRCGTQVREASACVMTDVLFRHAPPAVFTQADTQQRRCGLSLQSVSPMADGTPSVYLTPQGCVAVDRRTRRMFDARLCAHLASRTVVLFPNSDLVDECALRPQPLDLIAGDAAFPMLFFEGRVRLSADWLTNLKLDTVLTMDSVRMASDGDHAHEQTSHVLDWMGEDNAPVGFHITASAMDASEFAPMLFDSHYLYDPSQRKAFYAHSVARNKSLLADMLGAGGVCRAVSVGMPLFDANTNRICTRMARRMDSPTHPVSTPMQAGEGEETWPYTQTFMDRYFWPEECAASHDDVPWNATDAHESAAGDLPGWKTYVTLDAQGISSYPYTRFPPPASVFSPLPLFPAEDWGTCRVPWLDTPPCTPEQPQGGACLLSMGGVCLLPTNASHGVCVSAATFKAQPRRAPCFETAHCDDGMVCLADGACAPFRIHVWNRAAHTWDMEVTVLADECSFQDARHPYTQSTRGASPWEIVPDLLHVHGLCGHKEWFAYRNALWGGVTCSVLDANDMGPQFVGYMGTTLPEGSDSPQAWSYLACNASSTAWPWIQERFDGKRSEAPYQTLEEGRTLMALPHACDQAYMHLQNPWRPDRRLQVCSGFQGQPSDDRLVAYALHLGTDDWAGVNPVLGDGTPPSPVSQWMRTYDEASDARHVGVLNNDAMADVPLGFLGASRSAADVRGDMANKDVTFFRCVERMECSNPAFTYNGVQVERLDPTSLSANFSELSLRLCGAIGFTASGAASPWAQEGDGACWLDMAMFPLFETLLWPVSQAGCAALFGAVAQSGGFVTVVDTDAIDATLPLSTLQNSPHTLFCESRRGRCAFAARTSSRLTDASALDGVAAIGNALNGLLQGAARAVIGAVQALGGPTRTYEHVNRCAAQLLRTVLDRQTDLQAAYGTWGPGGLYLALRVVLFEIPVAWLHHAMLVALLSTVDASVPAPNLDGLGHDSRLYVFLWTDEDRAALCHNAADLNARPVLWRLICSNQHPAYTFAMVDDTVPDVMVEAVRAHTLQRLQLDLPSYSAATATADCYSGMAWACGRTTGGNDTDACVEAMLLAYNDTQVLASGMPMTECERVLNSAPPPWLDPCGHPEHFAPAGTAVTHTLRELEAKAPTGGGLDRYLDGLTQVAVDVSEAVATPVDFVGGGVWDDVVDAPHGEMAVPIARVWPMAGFMASFTAAQGGFNLTHWLRHGVCAQTLDSPSVLCANQYDTDAASDACMWHSNPPTSDRQRYLFEADAQEPAATLYYSDGTTERIPICDILSTKGPEGACVVQHMGTLRDASDATVPCDIVGVTAPAGVEIQGFAVRLPKGDTTQIHQNSWLGALHTSAEGDTVTWSDQFCTAAGDIPLDGSPSFMSNEIRSCTWTSTGDGELPSVSAWWSFNNTLRTSYRPELDGLYTLDVVDFGEMSQWWPGDASDWSSRGCASDAGLCSLRIRLSPAKKGVGAGVCTHVNSRGVRYVPDCTSITQSDQFEAFLVGRGPSTDLYRCGPCTRYHAQLRSNPEALFQCTLGTDAEGGARDNVLAAIAQTTSFLEQADALLPILLSGTNSIVTAATAWERTWSNGTALEVYAALSSDPSDLTLSLSHWGQRAPLPNSVPTSRCDAQMSPASCFAGMSDLDYFATDDLQAWTKAIANPDTEFTILCESQIYTKDQAMRCNEATDAPRRRLGAFVDQRYRKANGVWQPVVPPGEGLSWIANVASEGTGLFSLMYASAHRDEREVQTQWLLGQGPCSDPASVIQNRICVESSRQSQLPFQAIHPWVGGNFNPFDGFDQCGSAISGVQNALCACACAPDHFCTNPHHNYTSGEMLSEFPLDSKLCQRQAFATTPVMDATDPSNVCGVARAAAYAGVNKPVCTHTQGLFADAGGATRTVTDDELHSVEGVATRPGEFLIQDMYGADGQGNGLWAGSTLQQERVTGLERYAFLRMDRSKLHPAHIAFTTADGTRTGAPLLMAQVALLLHDTDAMPISASSPTWLSTMADDVRQDAAWVSSLYPQLVSTAVLSDVDWTCPLRAFAFWGGTSGVFAPVVPSPALAQSLFGLGGAHPLIQSRRVRDQLNSYVTTNGACFYLRDSDGALDVSMDGTHPCGLQGMLRLLQNGEFAPSRVMTLDATLSKHFVDTPDAGGTLRSGEKLESTYYGDRVGALPRLSPFLIRTRGDAGEIQRSTTLSTRSEGGDCHMGRALLFPMAQSKDIAGRACALVSKNRTAAQAACPQGTPSVLTFARARPLTLAELVAKPQRTYRDEIASDWIPIQFVGPGGVGLKDAESSVGLLFSSSLVRAIASELSSQGRRMGCVPTTDEQRNAWMGDAFWRVFTTGGPLWNCSASPQTMSSSVGDNNASSAYIKAGLSDADAWRNPNWTWSYYAPGTDTPTTVGSVNRTRWFSEGRFAACNASLYESLPELEKAAASSEVHPLSLCEPAATEGLQTLCSAFMQYRTDISNVNCELMGGGACLYQPGTFYVPYGWSASNQKFAADTVIAYYQGILAQPRFKAAPSFTQLCPQRNAWVNSLAALSRAQTQQCPGFQMEYVKNLLQQIKQVGYDVLYMAYCFVMFCGNAIGAAFAGANAFTMDAMLSLAAHYLGEFVRTSEKILMPILNAAVSVLFGTSTLGQIMSTALAILCEAFNILINRVVIPIWCAVVRPALYVIFNVLKDIVGLVSSDAANKIGDVWTAISGGDGGISPSTCLGSMVQHIDCSAGKPHIDDNQSNYLPAPVATRCWADSSAEMNMAGAGPLGGVGDASFLTCTGSDTCAQDPLSMDQSNGNLIACAACPTDASSAQQFGCDPMLKRCVCGTSTHMPDDCLTSSDCASSQCALVGDLDNVHGAVTNTPCQECGSLGMQPACVRRASGAVGTCACAAIAASGTFQTCSALGQRVPLLQATGYCLATADVSAHLLSPSLVLSFGDLSIVPCTIGLSENGCVGVNLPMASGGQFTRALTVILAAAPQASSSTRRRLLGSTAIRECVERFPHHRRRAKDCLHWRLVRDEMDSNATFWELMLKHPMHMIRRADAGLMPVFAEAVVWTASQAMAARTPGARRRVLLQETPPPSASTLGFFWNYHQDAGGNSDCELLSEAIDTIQGAWSDTVAYYEQGPMPANGNAMPQALYDALSQNNNNDNSTQATDGGLLAQMADAVLMGYGRRIVDALITPDGTRVLTGKRLLSELSTCNFTALTLGTRTSVDRSQGMSLLYILVATGLGVALLTHVLIPPGIASYVMWRIGFPMLFFWISYGVAPVCWPMVPPRIAHDLAAEVGAFLPLNGSWEIPRFLVREDCNVLGRLLLDGTFDPACFRKCDAEPFLFKSWQDVAAWWSCDFSTQLCATLRLQAASHMPGILGDFISSADYFGQVVAFTGQDPDFTAAFRTCAVFTAYHVILSLALALFVLLTLPALMLAILELFSASLVMLTQAAASEAAMRSD